MKKGKKKRKPTRHRTENGIRSARALATLQPFLDELWNQYHRAHWLSSDPVQFVHRYAEPRDREVVAFIAACFAYGSVELIHRAVGAVLGPMGASPAKFIENFDGENAWKGFYHRFHKEGHVVALVTVLRRALRDFGSLGGLFQACAEKEQGQPCERALNGAARWFRAEFAAHDPALKRGLLFFVNAPEDGSACKRMTMFLRWMVRSDEIDLGLWSWFHPRDLVIPADTHVSRIAHYLGLRGGREDRPPNWKMAREITGSLAAVCPEDPARYDFALARLGILDICRKKYTRSICERCPVEPGCRYSNMRSTTAHAHRN